MDDPGFRFHPTDQEIVGHYLARKAADPNFTCLAMGDLDIYKFQPWELPAKAKYSRPGDVQWWFYNLRDEVKGGRASRTTPMGYWKGTGKQHPIHMNSELAGVRNSLVFYSGRNPTGQRTDWILHEYRLANQIPGSSNTKWAVCCVFKKDANGRAPAGGDVLPLLQPVPGAAAVDDPLHPVAEQSFGSAVVDDPPLPVADHSVGTAVVDDSLVVVAEDSFGGAVIDHHVLPVPDNILDNFFEEKPMVDIAQQPYLDSIWLSDLFPGQVILDWM